MPGIQLAESALRIAVAMQLLTLCVFLLRNRQLNRSYASLAFLLFCIMGYQLAPLLLRHVQPQLPAYVSIVLAVTVPVAFWHFCAVIFRDGFATPSWFLPLATLTAILGMASFFTGDGTHLLWVDWLSQGSKIIWVIAAMAMAFKDWRSDLVESRRRLRLILITLTALYISAIMLVELTLLGPVPALLELLNVCAIFLLISALTAHLLSISGENFLVQIAEPGKTGPDISALAQRVLNAMTNERIYAEEGFNLDSLATALNSQPHQLRKVINGELGHRNFNAFVNRYRVEEVAARLQEAEYADTPLLTLALDAGFRSLAPFNRTFREHFGVTPSEYRNRT